MTASLQRIAGLIVKELLAIWKDWRTRVVVIGPPIIQLIVFSYAASFDVDHVAMAVLNEDAGLQGRELVARFEGSGRFDRLFTLQSVSEIAPLIEREQVQMVLHVPQDFSARLKSGRPAPLQVILDGRQSNTSFVVLGYAREIALAFSRERRARQGMPGPPASIVARAWFNPNLESRWFIVPGLTALLTLVVTIMLTALSVARERELGTFEQLLVTPLLPMEIMIGKTVPALIIGTFEGTLILIVAVFWFEIPFTGSFVHFYLGLIIYLLAVAGIGLMLSSIALTQQQALLGAFLFVVPAVILSGFATPLANIPDILERLSLVNPMRHFLELVRGLYLQALPWEAVWPKLAAMGAIAFVNLIAAAFLFRRRLG